MINWFLVYYNCRYGSHWSNKANWNERRDESAIENDLFPKEEELKYSSNELNHFKKNKSKV